MPTTGARKLAAAGFGPAAKVFSALTSPVRIDQSELKQKFESNGSLLEYGSSEKIVVAEPNAYNKYIKEVSRMRGEHEISQPFVGVIEDVWLVGSHPLAFKNYRYINDASVSHNVQFLNIIKSAINSPDNILQNNITEGEIPKAVLLFNSWSDNYFHWVTETLTRLEGIEKYTEKNNKPKLIVGPEINSFQREYLRLLGYDSQDIINWSGIIRKVKNLVVPSMRREINPGNPSPYSISWLRRKLRQRALREVNIDKFSSRIYVSREDADTRRVLNRREFSKITEEFGFEKHCMTDLDVLEGIALFAQADCIIAPHGAALVDLAYSDDIAVVELMPENRHNGVFYMATKQIGGWYGYLECKTKKGDMWVNTAELTSILEAAINRCQATPLQV